MQLAQVYSSNAPEKATQWLDTLDEGPVRDAALSSALNSFRHFDINKAFSLAETFSDEASRGKEIHQLMNDWANSDYETAKQALQNTISLTEERKEAILEDVFRHAKPRNEYILPQ